MMKKTAKILLIMLLTINMKMEAQDYIIFSDSPNSSIYESSWGSYNTSVVVLSGGKVPVDTGNKYSGLNSLRLRWKSVAGGNWSVSIAAAGLPDFDAARKDSLSFWAFSLADLDSLSLPLVSLEDSQNRKTAGKRISDFKNKLIKNTWTKIFIPLSVFTGTSDSADLTKIKSVSFLQNYPDGGLHTIYLDEIRMTSVKDSDNTPPAIPEGLSATGNTIYIKLSWTPNKEADLAGYRIYRQESGIYKIIGAAGKQDSIYNDKTGIPPKTYSYKISAFDINGNESELSSEASASTTSLSDSVLLDMTQRATFKFFWDHAHPVSGLARDRAGSGDIVTSGGSGFGVMAILVGAERGFVTRDAAAARILKILNFLNTKADRFHGAFSHWLNGSTGKVIPFSQKDDGGDLVETAFLIQGLLAARQYFNRQDSSEAQIRSIITSIWESVEWDWYRKDPNGNYLYWHWSPNYSWQMNFPLQGWNETMITYLLAIASPTHSVPASLYHLGWAGNPGYKNGKYYYNIPLEVGPDYGGPLFFAHYSFLGFDPRNKKDAYTNYFINNRNHTLIHQAYSIANPKKFPGYDADTWGLTASDDPYGYLAHEPNNDNGTISPTAAISSMPYTPRESINALKSFYYEYGSSLWGEYGFKDAFNLKENWYASSYLAIDQGPIIIMIENYRSQLLWKLFMANPEIKPMLDKTGFVSDSTSTGLNAENDNKFPDYRIIGNYPNPFNPYTTISFSLPSAQNVSVTVFDMLGRRIKTLFDGRLNEGLNKVEWDGSDEYGKRVSSGVYLYIINASGKSMSGKMLFQK